MNTVAYVTFVKGIYCISPIKVDAIYFALQLFVIIELLDCLIKGEVTL